MKNIFKKLFSKKEKPKEETPLLPIKEESVPIEEKKDEINVDMIKDVMGKVHKERDEPIFDEERLNETLKQLKKKKSKKKKPKKKAEKKDKFNDEASKPKGRNFLI